MTRLAFEVFDHAEVDVEIRHTFNAGYAGRDTAQVREHIAELAELGVPAPTSVPTLYPLSSSQVHQRETLLDGRVQVQHARTSGEAEWALIIPDSGRLDDALVTVACDHTDRELEVHGVAWSKQSSPDVVGRQAWLWSDIADTFDDFALQAWVDGDTLIQDGTAGLLLSPAYWMDALNERGLVQPGTVVMSGTIAMIAGVDQFAKSWRVALTAPDGRESALEYGVEVLPEPWD